MFPSWAIHFAAELPPLRFILDMVAMVVSEARELAELIGCIADLFTCAVGGCMGAQVHHEIKGDAAEVQHRTAPAVGAPESQEIER